MKTGKEKFEWENKKTLLRRCTGRTFKWPLIKKKHATFLNLINFAESKFKKGCLFAELATHMTPCREGLLQVEIEKCSVKNCQN